MICVGMDANNIYIDLRASNIKVVQFHASKYICLEESTWINPYMIISSKVSKSAVAKELQKLLYVYKTFENYFSSNKGSKGFERL